jgi:hypothetical protein
MTNLDLRGFAKHPWIAAEWGGNPAGLEPKRL